jgi:hypothetical protein
VVKRAYQFLLWVVLEGEILGVDLQVEDSKVNRGLEETYPFDRLVV